MNIVDFESIFLTSLYACSDTFVFCCSSILLCYSCACSRVIDTIKILTKYLCKLILQPMYKTHNVCFVLCSETALHCTSSNNCVFLCCAVGAAGVWSLLIT